MLQYDFHSSIGYWICSTSRIYERAMHQELLPEGITYRQMQVLGWLAHDGELSQVDLADKMVIEPPTLVRILDRMERDGLISRDTCPGDRRKKMIRPQPKARIVWKKIVRCAHRVRSRASRGFSKQQKEVLKRLLGMVQTNLAEVDAVSHATHAFEDGRDVARLPQPVKSLLES